MTTTKYYLKKKYLDYNKELKTIRGADVTELIDAINKRLKENMTRRELHQYKFNYDIVKELSIIHLIDVVEEK